jgi:hypothetical protein
MLELAKALRALESNPSLTYLGIFSFFRALDGLVPIFLTLQTNATLTSLDLSCNCMGRLSARRLAEVIKVHAVLTSVELSHNFVGDEGVEHLAEALKDNRNLMRLGLRLNSIDDGGGCYLAGALQSNVCLTHLDLAYNQIGVEGLQRLSVALKSNTTLTCLDLRGNFEKAYEGRSQDKVAEEADVLMREIERQVQQNKVPQLVLVLQVCRSNAAQMEVPSFVAERALSRLDALHFFLVSGPDAEHERQCGNHPRPGRYHRGVRDSGAGRGSSEPCWPGAPSAPKLRAQGSGQGGQEKAHHLPRWLPTARRACAVVTCIHAGGPALKCRAHVSIML